MSTAFTARAPTSWAPAPETSGLAAAEVARVAAAVMETAVSPASFDALLKGRTP